MAEAELTPAERLSAAFMAAMHEYPYFASGLALLVRRLGEIPEGTMGVTRAGVLLVDPRFVVQITVRELAEVLVHELSHLLREHAERSDRVSMVDRFRWNVAADCEINQGLQRQFLPKPCLPETFGLPDGLMAEEYYERLPDDLSLVASIASGACGSGSGGDPILGESEAGGEEGRSAADVARARSEVAAAVVAHAARRGRGSVPSQLLRWAERQLLPPQVCWRDKLRRLVRASLGHAAGKSDYTFRRPGRRSAGQREAALALGGQDVVLPSLCGFEPHIAVGLDTSGSRGEEEIAVAMSEVEGVLKASGAAAVFLACDCQMVGPPVKIRRAADAAKYVRGGGGTDFCVIMAAVEKLRPRPDLFIFLTDGDGPAPQSPPVGTRVLWVLVGKDAKVPAQWGEWVRVEASAA